MSERMTSVNRAGVSLLAAPLFFLALACCAAFPRSAQAQCCANETAAIKAHQKATVAELVTQVTHLSDLVDLADYLNKAFDAFVQYFQELMSVNIATIASSQSALGKLDYLLHQDEVKFDAALAEQSIIAEFTGDHYVGPSRVDCYTSMARMGMVSSEMAMGRMADSIARMIEQRFLYVTSPMDAYRDFKDAVLCPKDSKFPKGIPSQASPPAECMETAGSDFDGLSSSARVINGMLLEWSDTKTVTIDGKPHKVFDPQNDQQKKFVAAMQYNFLVAGFRPPPPRGEKAIKSGPGMTQTTQWTICASRESALTRPFATQTAYYTRPGCSTNSAKFPSECKDSERTYRMAELAGVDMAAYPEMDKNEGLSPAQIDYLNALIGLTPQTGVQLAASGATNSKGVEVSQLGALVWTTLQQKKELMEQKTATAAARLADFECYPGDKPVPGLSASVGEDSQERPPAAKASVLAGPADDAHKVEIRVREKATVPLKASRSLPKGTPVAADEIDLPETVAQ